MRARSILVMLVGLGVAGGSVLYAKTTLGTPGPVEVAAGPALVEVVVAGMDIPFGAAIEGHMVTTQAWPREALPPGAFTEVSQVIAGVGGDPRRAKGRLSQGELLLASKISEFGEKVTIVQALGENTRAMAIQVDAVSGVAGFVTPGDRVDVVLTQGAREDLRAATILQDIRVIGVDQATSEEKDQPTVARTVTVEVTAAQGQKLALAQKAGTLSLSLRTVNSVQDQRLQAITLDDLLSAPVEVAEDEPQPIGWRVRVRRGTETETVTSTN